MEVKYHRERKRYRAGGKRQVDVNSDETNSI